MRRALSRTLVLAIALAAAPAGAQPAPAEAGAADQQAASPAEATDEGAEAASRDEEEEEVLGADFSTLAERVRATAAAEREEDEAREARFLTAKQDQEAETLRVEALARAQEARSLQLEETYGEYALLIEEMDERLTERIGQMGELFGVVRLVATDLSGDVYESLTSLGLESRQPLLDKLGRNPGVPSTQDMEKLWFELLREMTVQASVEVVPARVITEWTESENGKDREPAAFAEQRVVRAGPFTAISQGEFVQWVPKHETVQRLERQPPDAYMGGAASFEGGSGLRRLAVDPSRGVLLEALTGAPSLGERVNQGGYVGYTIVLLGVTAVILGLLRLVGLTSTARRVAVQERSSSASSDNPLGRLLGTYAEHEHDDPEALELRLDHSLLKESAGVQRHLWIVQTISIIAPLLGLLGTVTGMIQTFQAITLFGAGDPKMMAGGISEALVTTTLGLVTAIPLVLLHSLLSSRARAIIDVLEERRSALIATRLQKTGVPV